MWVKYSDYDFQQKISQIVYVVLYSTTNETIFFWKIEYRTQLGDIVFNMENNIFPGYLGQTKCPNQHDCKYCETFLNQPAPSTGEHKSSTE